MATYEIHARSYLGDFDAPRARVEVWRGNVCLAETLHESIPEALTEARALVRRLRKAGAL